MMCPFGATEGNGSYEKSSSSPLWLVNTYSTPSFVKVNAVPVYSPGLWLPPMGSGLSQWAEVWSVGKAGVGSPWK